jgi:hypothetical protein
VLRLLRPLFRDALLPAAAGALLFGLHPLTSESVAWLSSQGDLLAVTFGLLALILMERRGVRRTLAGSACFVLACLSKESLLILPALLVLRDLALPRGEGASPWASATWTRVGMLVCLAGLYFALRLHVVEGLAQVEHPGGSVWATARGMLSGLVWYAGALLWPFGFSFDVRVDLPLRWSEPVVAVGLGLLLTMLAAGAWGLARRRYLLALATLGLLVSLGPVSNVIVPLKAFVADRFLYPGLVCVAAGLGAALLRARGTVAYAAGVVVLGLLAGLAALTVGRNGAWANEARLWEAVRHDRPANPNAYQGLAYEYARQERIALAERAFASYHEANPYDGKALRRLGDLFGRLAQTLVMVDPEFARTTNIDARRKQARWAQLRAYERALAIWSVPGGLDLGRGSETMRRHMLERWIEAALDLADLGDARGLLQARFANDRLIDLDAGARRHDDPEAVMRAAPWLRRRVRVGLALGAVQGLATPGISDTHRALLRQARAVLLPDVGLDPARSDASIRPSLTRLVGALIDDGLADGGVRPDRRLFLDHAALLVAAGRRSAARAALQKGLRAHPRDPTLEQELRQLEALIRGRRGG